MAAAVVSGDQLAALFASGLGASAGGEGFSGAGGVSEDLSAARASELQHELVALLDGKLTLNYANYEEFRARADPDAPTLVVSFLGDTSVGKSTVIRALIGDGGEFRPFVQRSSTQSASTTYNVNMYTSARVLDGFAVHFLVRDASAGLTVLRYWWPLE